MADELKQLLSEYTSTGEFKPYCAYSREADALTVYFKDDPDYSKRLTDHVSLFLSLKSGEVVGCRIKGVSGILADLPNYLRVNHDDLELSVIFLPFRGEAKDDETRRIINELAKAASEHSMRLEECSAI